MCLRNRNIPSPHEMATAAGRRYERRPTDVSGGERRIEWKGHIPSPHEMATAMDRRYERRPTDVSEGERRIMWKGHQESPSRVSEHLSSTERNRWSVYPITWKRYGIFLTYLCGGFLVSVLGCGEEPDPEIPAIHPEMLRLPGDQEPLFPADPVAMFQRDSRTDELAESAAAESPDPAARTRYALDFVAGKVVAQNPSKVLEWLKTAADAGDAEACKAFYSYQLRYGSEKERRRVLPQVRTLAQSGDMESQLLMAKCCLLGNAGEPRDEAQAAKWYRLAAEQGDRVAQFCLGVYHQTGTFPIGDSAQLATELLREMNAAKRKDSTTPNPETNSTQIATTENSSQDETVNKANAAESTENSTENSAENSADRSIAETATDTTVQPETKGDSAKVEPTEKMSPNPQEAAQWYRRAAEQDFAPAQVALGRMFLQGEGVERNPTQGLQWLQRAAENGDLESQFAVGQCYLNGIGTQQSSSQGVQWIQQAANGGHAAAMETLGSLYQSGNGVVADASQAVKWFRRAADLGRERAAFLLGMCYQEGTGVSADPEEALRWFRTAATLGDHMARNMLKILEEPNDE